MRGLYAGRPVLDLQPLVIPVQAGIQKCGNQRRTKRKGGAKTAPLLVRIRFMMAG